MALERDYFDGVLKYVEQMLMEEEDMQNHKARMFHEGSALQAAEKSFYDVLGEKFPRDYLLDDSIGTSSSQCSNSSNVVIDNFVESNGTHDQGESETVLDQPCQPNSLSFASSTNFSNVTPFVHSVISSVTPLSVLGLSSQHQFARQEKTSQFLFNDNNVSPRLVPIDEDSKLSPKVSKGRKNPYQEATNDYFQEERSNKQLASYSEEPKQSEMYDKVLLCPALNPGLHSDNSASHSRDFLIKESKARRPRSKRQGNTREFIDLKSFLTQCAQALATGDIQSANKILKCIRQHSSPYGDGTERLVHYFSNAIEARLAGTGMALYTAFTKRRISAVNILKAYQAYLTAVPFQRMSNIFANKSIYKLARGAKRLHIIDFGILHGFQWPCIIQGLSLGPGEPPKLRLTGIDLPQPGFRPAERVEETGLHLAQYCKRFNVPFEFNAIAKKWDDIQLEDLKIEKDVKLVVNCLYRLRHVLDETVVEIGPRDKVLNLIKNINPDLFVHGVLNGSYNSPFFITRFREALFHFSSLFDMLEASALREDKSRLLFEQEVFARDVMNVIACEGTARIERPETYKQWKFRNMKAGFRQLPLHKDLMKEVGAKVRLHYHKDFLVDEENKWMIQGWKGRVLYALSLWEPVQE